MTENGDPLENAIAERVNGIIKDGLFEIKTDLLLEEEDYVLISIKIN